MLFHTTLLHLKYLSKTENGPHGMIENKGNFKGCMRNVVIGERKMEWTDFFLLYDVMVSSCPLN